MMAFPGHSRSLALTCTSVANASIGNVHPDRHHHIELEQSTPKRRTTSGSRRAKHFSLQQDPHQKIDDPINNKDVPVRRNSSRNSIAIGTDDVGNAPTTSLWVGNVPSNLTHDELWVAFERFGHILSVRATPSKHCGFVNFVDVDAAVRAWHECHERDIFSTGVAVYVRYETPPSWLRDKHPSLKRKRASVDTYGSLAHDLKKPIPTGPRSQNVRGISQDNLKSQQTCISPPPLRRYDTYRPHNQSEEDRSARLYGERQGQLDLYRPSYSDDNMDSDHDSTDEIGYDDNAEASKRSSFNNNEDPSSQSRPQTSRNPTEYQRSSAIHQVETPGSNASPTRKLSRETAGHSLGMGIKGLAASRRVSSNAARDVSETRQPGLQIKGTATQSKVGFQDMPATVSRNDVTSRKLATIDASHMMTSSDERVKPSRRIQEADEQEAEAHFSGVHKQTMGQAAPFKSVPVTADDDRTASGKDDSHKTGDWGTLVRSVEEDKSFIGPLMSKEKLGFAHLSHLFEVKEKEDFAAQKARTISPFSRIRASSRGASSVKSAKTDPTPVVEPPNPDPEVCGKCKIDGARFRLFKCAVSSCAKKFHSMCGNLSPVVSNNSKQKAKFLCDGCLDNGKHDRGLQSESKSNPELHAADGQVKELFTPLARNGIRKILESSFSELPMAKPDTKISQANKSSRAKDWDSITRKQELLTTNVNGLETGSSSTLHTTDTRPGMSHANNGELMGSALASLEWGAVKMPSAAVLDLGECTVSKDHAETGLDMSAMLSAGSTQLKCPPPTEPRSMRNGELNGDPNFIAARYKNEVTCPWWKKGSKCVRRAEDCMFAHRITGIESPNGRTPAKDWTCFDYGTTLGCRFSEKECLYSHKDTGLYVGLDGKASKKHLECYWWYHRRCRFADSECTCAHFTTGLVAEEPMPRDSVRRGPSQTSIPFLQGNEVAESSCGRSPSYSPPPPSITEKTIRDSHRILPVDQGTPPSPHGRISSQKTQANTVIDVSDPRLRRGIFAEPSVDQSADLNATAEAERLSTSDAHLVVLSATGHTDVDGDHRKTPQSRQLTMKSCKNCSKRVFKADICTDCLKASQRDDNGQTTAASQNTDQELEIKTIEPRSTVPTFATPAPKILKRTRSGSSSNMFASKRQRPNITMSRSNTRETNVTGTLANSVHPVTLEQLNRKIAEQKAKDNLQTEFDTEEDHGSATLTTNGEQHYPSTTLTTNSESSLLPDSTTKVSSMSPVTILESPIDMFQPSNLLPGELSKSKNPGRDSTRHLDHIETLREAYDDLRRNRSRSKSVASDDANDSDTPLVELRHREENPLWSPSTSTQSPQQLRLSCKTPAVAPTRATKSSNTAFGPSTRCRTCVRYHRKCVHNAKGEYDSRKCFEWQQERNAIGVKQKTHYTESERVAIKEVAEAFEAGLPDYGELVDPPTEVSARPISSRTVANAYSDEDAEAHQPRESQKPPAWIRVLRTPSSPFSDPSRETSRSSSPVDQQTISHSAFPALKKPEDAVRSKDIAGIISRLKARGVVFEDSDSEDDLNHFHDEQLAADKRFDPLLSHKQKDDPSPTIPRLPKITKGQGLKYPQLVYRRQMKRNFQLFGNPHKEVDRKVLQQNVSAMIQIKDPDDLLAAPREAVEKVTFQEFLGLPQGHEMEACLGKVSLPRGKATLELAFREREMEPGLGAWGREKRGSRREKPVYVIGL